VTQASEKITGTVDVADASSTVDVLDNGKQVATATVGTSGAWSATVTLAKGSNVITATDTNAAGTGTSDPVTYNYQPQTPSTPTSPTTPVSTTPGSSGGTPSGQSHHHWSHYHHHAVTATSPGTSTTTSAAARSGTSATTSDNSTSSSQSQPNHIDVSHWLNNHPDFARPTATLSEAGASTSGVVSAPSTTTTDPTAGAGAKAYALLNQMMAGDFDGHSHFAQAATAFSASSQQQANLLTRPLH
jgi:hypothetical protein